MQQYLSDVIAEILTVLYSSDSEILTVLYFLCSFFLEFSGRILFI